MEPTLVISAEGRDDDGDGDVFGVLRVPFRCALQLILARGRAALRCESKDTLLI
jgi:hypothetical protein